MPVSGGRPRVANDPGRGVAAAAARAADNEGNEGNEYSEALARLAGDANVTPREFERAILLEAAAQRLTPDCITLDEIELFPTLAQFPEARRHHVEQCRACARFVEAISPRVDEIELFVASAVTASSAATAHLLHRDRASGCHTREDRDEEKDSALLRIADRAGDE